MPDRLEEVRSLGSPSKKSTLNATMTSTEKEPEKPFIASEYMEQSLGEKAGPADSSTKSECDREDGNQSPPNIGSTQE